MESITQPLEPVRLESIKVDGFWKQQVKRITEKWIPHCIQQMEPGGEGEELLNIIHAGKILDGEEGDWEFTGLPWTDAYAYNIIEAISLALCIDPEGDKDLEEAQDFLRTKLEEWIPIILSAQMEDGYIHSFHTVGRRERYTQLRHHEFYVQGYFIEMGVAHYRATGGKDRRLYDAAVRCADELCRRFGPSPKTNWHYGHQGMGYALCRMARLVNEVEGRGAGDKYQELAKFFLDHRYDDEELRDPYRQSHAPVIEQDEAVGHAVRATYFYTAIADLAVFDEQYGVAADRLWDSAINRKMYITGGVGASHEGEAFDVDYELRNNGYLEVCAGCGLSFWADRMHRLHKDSHYVDVMERVLYNNILGALELSGEKYYYQNPLESEKPRHSWHGCPCCVGNIPRALITLKDRLYSINKDRDQLYVNHFVASEAVVDDVAGARLGIRQETAYPWKGDVAIVLEPLKKRKFSLLIRIPDRTESGLYTAVPELGNALDIKVNGKAVSSENVDGYAVIDRTWKKGDRVEFSLPMDVQRIYCDERALANRGRVALQRGPIVYNFEDVDNAVPVSDLLLKPEVPLETEWRGELLEGIMVIQGDGLLAVPNFVRLNRGGASQVWITEDPDYRE